MARPQVTDGGWGDRGRSVPGATGVRARGRWRDGHTGEVLDNPLARRLLIFALLAVAIGLLALGALYQADTPPEVVLTNLPPGSGGEPAGEAGAPGPGAEQSPITGWFPQGGQGAACTEPVGVALQAGYQASLVINGIPIPDDQLNGRASASGTLNHYTWGPEPDCPRGRLLRPKGNLLEACVWRAGEARSGCRAYRFEFDAL